MTDQLVLPFHQPPQVVPPSRRRRSGRRAGRSVSRNWVQLALPFDEGMVLLLRSGSSDEPSRIVGVL